MKETNRKKIGLALGGGGARGFCHIGVIEVFLENNIPIDFVSGCSMGSIVGGCYAAGVSISELCDLCDTINQSVVMDIQLSKRNFGFIKGNRAVSVIESLVGDKLIEECNIPFRATATDLSNAELRVFDSGKLIDAMRASMSIPIAFHAVEEEGSILVDGGVLETIPIDCCRAMGADVVIAVDALGGKPPKGYEPNDLVDVIERSYMLLNWSASRENEKKADLVICPDQGYRSIMRFKDNMYSVEQGRIAAREMLPKIIEAIS